MSTTQTARARTKAPANIHPVDNPLPMKIMKPMESRPIHIRQAAKSRMRIFEGRKLLIKEYEISRFLPDAKHSIAYAIT